MQQILQNKGTIEFNQGWINKAIADGKFNFLPSRKIPGMSIGEYIEARYSAERIIREKAYIKYWRKKYYGY